MMLTFGGIGLFLAGVLLTVMPHKFTSNAGKAAKAKKQGPILAVIGAAALVLALWLGGTIA